MPHGLPVNPQLSQSSFFSAGALVPTPPGSRPSAAAAAAAAPLNSAAAAPAPSFSCCACCCCIARSARALRACSAAAACRRGGTVVRMMKSTVSSTIAPTMNTSPTSGCCERADPAAEEARREHKPAAPFSRPPRRLPASSPSGSHQGAVAGEGHAEGVAKEVEGSHHRQHVHAVRHLRLVGVEAALGGRRRGALPLRHVCHHGIVPRLLQAAPQGGQVRLQLRGLAGAAGRARRRRRQAAPAAELRAGGEGGVERRRGCGLPLAASALLRSPCRQPPPRRLPAPLGAKARCPGGR